MAGLVDASWVLTERGVLKKSGKQGKREHVQKYSMERFFWKGVFEQLGKSSVGIWKCGERVEEQVGRGKKGGGGLARGRRSSRGDGRARKGVAVPSAGVE